MIVIHYSERRAAVLPNSLSCSAVVQQCKEECDREHYCSETTILRLGVVLALTPDIPMMTAIAAVAAAAADAV